MMKKFKDKNIKDNIVIGESIERILAPSFDEYCDCTSFKKQWEEKKNRRKSSISDSVFVESNSAACKVYAFSNEELGISMKPYNYTERSVLTVGSSGDQALMSLLLGAKDVTVADLNPMAHFYIELKKAAIKNLTLEEFKDYFSEKNLFNPKYYAKVSHDLDAEAKLFWDSVMLENGEEFDMRNNFLQYGNVLNIVDIPYCTSETEYVKLQKILKDKSINYKVLDVADFPKLNRKFDAILLSNVIDYIHFDDYKKIVNDIIDNVLAEDGFMQVAYGFTSTRMVFSAFDSLIHCFSPENIIVDIYDKKFNDKQLIYFNGKNPKKEEYQNISQPSDDVVEM